MIKLKKDSKEDGVYFSPYSGGCGYHIIKDNILYRDLIIKGCHDKMLTDKDVYNCFINLHLSF